MEAMGMMRDLDQIRERDDGRETSRLALIALGGLAAACVLFAAGVLIGRDGEPGSRMARREDPLARLDALSGEVADAGAPVVTYPDRLIDPPSSVAAMAVPTLGAPSPDAPSGVRPSRTTNASASALIDNAVRVRSGLSLGPAQTGPLVRIVPSAGSAPSMSASSPPAQLSSGTTATAPVGSDGAYTLQVSSFRALSTAQSFALRLREHGHRAFVSTGGAPAGSAPWHRVRVGPFASLRDASRYRADFETRERLPTFVVHQNAEAAHGG